jgi:hypothetical protein
MLRMQLVWGDVASERVELSRDSLGNVEVLEL